MVNPLGMNFTFVDGGDGNPFYICVNPLSQSNWRTIMNSEPWAGRRSPFTVKVPPAMFISWNEVQVYLRRLNTMDDSVEYRLPTEEEWTQACLTGNIRGPSFSNEANIGFWLEWTGSASGPFPILKGGNWRGNVLVSQPDFFDMYVAGDEFSYLGTRLAANPRRG